MEIHRLRAPTGDGELLEVPPLSEASRMLGANRGSLKNWDHDFQGRSARRLRAQARTEVAALARRHHERFGLDQPRTDFDPSGPWIVAGHQPELFHPGVWAKNFALAGLASAAEGTSLNLIVDNDVPRSATIRVPERTGSRWRIAHVDFDLWKGDPPYEDWTVHDEALFGSFGARVRQVLRGVPDPLIDSFWPRVLETATLTDRVGLRFAVARRAMEADWGACNAEVALSDVCGTEAFNWFLAHILAHLPRFQIIHNAALQAYRRQYRIRSKQHPVPALNATGEWLEAPFWVWSAASPRRRPLLVRQRRATIDLRCPGDDDPFLTDLPLGPDRDGAQAVDRLRELPTRGVRIRTRALTTTMVGRLLIGDLFIHGIGGAKYDELGDAIIRDFFELEPPGYLALSMTAWLGLGQTPASIADLHAIERRMRDLVYNPDRFLSGTLTPDQRAALAARAAAIAGPIASHRERAARYHEVRRCNAILGAGFRDHLQELERERHRLQSDLADNALAHGRDYAFVLHSRARLHSLFSGLLRSCPETSS